MKDRRKKPILIIATRRKKAIKLTKNNIYPFWPVFFQTRKDMAMLANPEQAAGMGRAARKFIEERASLDLFVERIVAAIRAGHAARFGA